MLKKIGLLLTCCSLSFFVYSEEYPTNFHYDSESLKGLTSNNEITLKSLQLWDQITPDFFSQSKLSNYDKIRVWTYLYSAQEDFANLSHQITGRFEGHLDAVSYGILHLFNPDYKQPVDYASDPYSDKLASIVVSKYAARLNEENGSGKEYSVPMSYKANKDTNYTEGVKLASWNPWVIKSLEQYTLPPLPEDRSEEWTKQIAQIKEKQQTMTDKDRYLIHYWANTGDWRNLTNEYLFAHTNDLEKALIVRAKVMQGIYDTNIVCYINKYKYAEVRPKVKDSSITYMIDLPMHPSYPSGHSAISMASATILSHYFPEGSSYFYNLAEEAGISRIYAGIHYPHDNIRGQQLGKDVGNAIIASDK